MADWQGVRDMSTDSLLCRFSLSSNEIYAADRLRDEARSQPLQVPVVQFGEVGATPPAPAKAALMGAPGEAMRRDTTLPPLTLCDPNLLQPHFNKPEPNGKDANPGEHRAEPNGTGSAPKEETTSDPLVNKLTREAIVIGGGIGEGIFYGMANLPEKLPQIGTSVAIGAALSALSKTGKLGAVVAFTAGAYFTSRYILNTINDHERWNKFGAAVSDTWNTNEHTVRNMHDVASTAGEFTFDTGLSMAAGYVGYKNPYLAELLIKVIKLPVPVPIGTPPPVSPAFLSATMLMDIVPPRYHDIDYHRSGNISTWSFDINLQGSIQRNTQPRENISPEVRILTDEKAKPARKKQLNNQQAPD